MWKKKGIVLTCALLHNHPWRTTALRRSSSSVSSAVNSTILRSLKDHFLDATGVSPPPRMKPPEPFEVVKGAIAGKGPVLRRSFGDGEEITVSAERLAGVHGREGDDEDIGGELLVRVEVSKAEERESLHFVCGLFPDAVGIDAVFMIPKSESIVSSTAYTGPPFRDLDQKVRDSFHKYIEERGVNETLFPFLQVWLYVNDHRILVRWLKSVATFIKGHKSPEDP